jgi:hypothetical protein
VKAAGLGQLQIARGSARITPQEEVDGWIGCGHLRIHHDG